MGFGAGEGLRFRVGVSREMKQELALLSGCGVNSPAPSGREVVDQSHGSSYSSRT